MLQLLMGENNSLPPRALVPNRFLQSAMESARGSPLLPFEKKKERSRCQRCRMKSFQIFRGRPVY